MRRVADVVKDYNQSSKTDNKKTIIIEWFKKHPGERFDITEVHQELGDELDNGRERTGQILRELTAESILTSHGNQRKAYELSEDIIVPARYQAVAGLRHLSTVIDAKRWGIVGVFVMTTIIWFFLTLPFWFFTVILLISPENHIASISEYELIVFTIAMTIWLLALTILSTSLQYLRLWWKSSSQSS